MYSYIIHIMYIYMHKYSQTTRGNLTRTLPYKMSKAIENMKITELDPEGWSF